MTKILILQLKKINKRKLLNFKTITLKICVELLDTLEINKLCR